jgi:hypothetical protein
MACCLMYGGNFLLKMKRRASQRRVFVWMHKYRQLNGVLEPLFSKHRQSFGLRLPETPASGLSVIANNMATFREFPVDMPKYLPPDAQLWTQIVQDHALDAGRPQTQLERLATWQPPSWGAYFANMMPWLYALRQQSIGARHD